MFDWLSNFSMNHPWLPLVLSTYLAIVKVLQGIRDSMDKTPATDDSGFERFVTILGKTVGYLGGIRPKAPTGVLPVTESLPDAIGVKVKAAKAIKSK